MTTNGAGPAHDGAGPLGHRSGSNRPAYFEELRAYADWWIPPAAYGDLRPNEPFVDALRAKQDAPLPGAAGRDESEMDATTPPDTWPFDLTEDD